MVTVPFIEFSNNRNGTVTTFQNVCWDVLLYDTHKRMQDLGKDVLLTQLCIRRAMIGQNKGD